MICRTPAAFAARKLASVVATGWLRIASMIGPIVVGFFASKSFGIACGAFAVVAAVSVLVVLRWAVETKERVLEEISG